MRGYWQLARNPRFLALVLASGMPFNGMFLYVLSAPVFLGEHLQLAPDAVLLVLHAHHRRHHGRRLGVGAAGRAHQAAAPDPPRLASIMLVVSLLNVALNLLFEPHWAWAMLPIAVFSFGWSLMVPVVTLLVLDQVPDRRGMASSVQACLAAWPMPLVAGVLVPLVMHSHAGAGRSPRWR